MKGRNLSCDYYYYFFFCDQASALSAGVEAVKHRPILRCSAASI